MELLYNNISGILMYSVAHLFNYNSSNPTQWYNFTFTRELKAFELIDIPQDPPNGGPDGFDIVLIIILIAAISAGTLVGVAILRKTRKNRGIESKKVKKLKSVRRTKPIKTRKPLKHNPKRQLENKTKIT